MQRSFVLLVAAGLVLVLGSCSSEERGADSKPASSAAAPAPAASTPPSLPKGLLLALSQFEVAPDGKVLPKPGAARLEWLTRRDGVWRIGALEDGESNVFHKGMVYTPPGAAPGILTLGGNAAAVKLWRGADGGLSSQPVWRAEFGGQQNRMRDAEVGDVLGDGRPTIAVATHDQGVVALVIPDPDGSFEVREIDRQPETFVHEIELGDLDGDGMLEVYATPSEPNRMDGTPQSGKVVRYVPQKPEGRTVVADLGNRHAKEILVQDVDGDGRDELYVCVEAETEGSGSNMRIKEPVEVRRFDAGTDPAQGETIATIDDLLCRFLTAGDVDGDGRKEIVASAFKSGVWLLRPPATPTAPWRRELIDAKSSGFEHAALLTDLDGDGTDELYVAGDDQGELKRYVWKDGRPIAETVLKRKVPGSVLTWNLMPVPVELLPPAETAATPPAPE
jgi:hypothetical protein